MEVMLIVGLFASSALSLNFIVNQKYKLAGSMNIINLCLVVATAYQFDQVKNIVWLFGIAAGVVLVYFVVRFLLKKKKKEKQQSIENKVVDVDDVDKENLRMEKVLIEIEMENGDVMKGELYPEVAPITVENFLKLIDEDFFAGLIFHRVIPGFMIQGGGYTKDFKEKHCDSIKGEFKSNGVNNELKHTEGVLSMARTMIKDSASSQFFIMHKPAPHLDGEYAAFGKITEGLDIVDQIANVPTNFQDCPTAPVVIKTIRRA